MTRFRYTGPNRTVFSLGGVGEVAPGEEFDVPADLAARFRNHGHIEELPAIKPKTKPADSPATTGT